MNRRKLKKALNALPKTSADAVADELMRRGHVGTRQSACNCPIANYLKAETGDAWAVHGDPDDGGMWAGGDPCDDEGIDLSPFDDHPGWPAIVDFIRLFDMGEWPRLVAGA